MGFTKETARTAGRKGGQVKQRLHLEEVEHAFGQLTTIEDAQRRLERLGVWAAAGLLPGSVAGAAVRSVEVWLKAHESELTQSLADELSDEVASLMGQLGQRKRPGVKVVR